MATQIDRMRTADNHDEWSEANEKSIENWVFSNHRVRNQEVRTEKSWNSKAWCNFGQFSEKICEIIFSHSFIFLATFYQLESNFEVSSRWNWFLRFHLPFDAKATAINRFPELTQIFRSQSPFLLQHQDVNTENCFSYFLCEAVLIYSIDLFAGPIFLWCEWCIGDLFQAISLILKTEENTNRNKWHRFHFIGKFVFVQFQRERNKWIAHWFLSFLSICFCSEEKSVDVITE